LILLDFTHNAYNKATFSNFNLNFSTLIYFLIRSELILVVRGLARC